MTQSTTGSCLCGAVAYRFDGPQFAFQYCHCSRCRKFTGSVNAANILIDPKNFEWLRGEELVGRFEHPEARHFATSFCTRCGSSLPWKSQSGGAVVVPAGTLDDDPGTRPTQNIFWASRPPWRVEAGDLQSFDELPPRKEKS